MVNFENIRGPVGKFLKGLSIHAEFMGHNDLRVNGFKVSGNAEHVYKNRVLHHGTLLFNSNLDMLRESLKTSPGKYLSKSVASVPASVKNLSQKPFSEADMLMFIEQTTKYFAENHHARPVSLPPAYKVAIEELAENKYKTWDWIFGYSPKYSFTNSLTMHQRRFYVQFNVAKGIIECAEVKIDNATITPFLQGKRHGPCDLLPVFKDHAGFAEFTQGELFSLLF
ncbi:MAG: hypothetical protein HC896_08780 [Bacteroidales bacterium]|nr:hypothetical protein [Bacteroidales bacterium]